MWIEDITCGLHEKYNTCDPRVIIEALGFLIVDKPFEDIFGVMVRRGKSVVIGVSTLQPAPVRRYAYGHELGHALLHEGLDVCFMERNQTWNDSKVERQADVFSALLLLPDALMAKYRGYSIESAADALGVPSKL